MAQSQPDEWLRLCQEMPDLAAETLADLTNQLAAVRIYAEGVMNDFPSTQVWMMNIKELAKGSA